MSTTQQSDKDVRPHVELFTDGACIGNPGPGGWAFLLRHPPTAHAIEGSGGERQTTNNRMEITAVIRGVESLRQPSVVLLKSDSLYVIKAIREWMAVWRTYAWRKGPRAKEQVKNADLWQRLDEVLRPHTVTPIWVRGHAGHRENERCDFLAAAQAEKMAALPPVASPAPFPSSLFETLKPSKSPTTRNASAPLKPATQCQAPAMPGTPPGSKPP